MGSSSLLFFAFLIVMIGVMWWMNRSQRKRQQAQRDKLNTMEPGTEVVTIGGLHGVLSAVGETTVDVDCEGVILTFEKTAIRTFNAPAAATPASPEVKADDKKDETPESPIDEK